MKKIDLFRFATNETTTEVSRVHVKIWLHDQKTFWGCEVFLPEFLQTCPKSFCTTGRPFFRMMSKKHFLCFCVFLQTLGPMFARIFRVVHRFAGILTRFSRIFPGASGILPGFSTYKKFWGYAFTPWIPLNTAFTSPHHYLEAWESTAVT